jgi:hypothetical protein
MIPTPRGHLSACNGIVKDNNKQKCILIEWIIQQNGRKQERKEDDCDVTYLALLGHGAFDHEGKNDDGCREIHGGLRKVEQMMVEHGGGCVMGFMFQGEIRRIL